jgi:hypothetical protein
VYLGRPFDFLDPRKRGDRHAFATGREHQDPPDTSLLRVPELLGGKRPPLERQPVVPAATLGKVPGLRVVGNGQDLLANGTAHVVGELGAPEVASFVSRTA